ncbi:integrase [Nocardia sp. alder85J]|uniref:integrase n=1 Tax=Nocardia sp. alder85J TaxID=2862949 RepID=UPI001CD2DCF9|nr:integrase [Nocardia sp. alder85J]MCX4097633.1 integrase [Nocardia sp. alder85J]
MRDSLNILTISPAMTLAERKALTRSFASSYARADKLEKTRILNQVCAATGWHRNHARKALSNATQQESPAARTTADHVKYDGRVVEALQFCWTILDQPAGKRLAPILPELVGVLRRHGELAVDDRTAELLGEMSPATIDRRLAEQRRRHPPAAPRKIRLTPTVRDDLTALVWNGWDHTRPGFTRVTMAHDGRARTLTVADIATGWTESRVVATPAHAATAVEDIARILPFPILGLGSIDCGREADAALLAWCRQRRLTFARSRTASCELPTPPQRPLPGELALSNELWTDRSLLTNYFHPQQRLVGNAHGRRYDTVTPYQRVLRHPAVTGEDKAILADTYRDINPAAVHRRLKSAAARLHALRV